MSNRFEVHSHTMFSNIRLLDCINRPEKLIDRAVEIGLKGISITDHECISAHVIANKYGEEIRKEHPDFKIGLGNEIYLTDTRDKNQRYWHFILIAKDKEGHKQLSQLSSRAWMQSYYDHAMERVPTLKSELIEVVNKNPGHLIATSACIGGELSANVLMMQKARQIGDNEGAAAAYQKIVNFIDLMQQLFGDDFYIECAPGASNDQIIVNKKLIEIAKVYNKKMVIGTDAHYLKKEDRWVHKAYLNSKGGEREVDSFYEFAYLQDENQIKENLTPSIVDAYDWMCQNSMEIYNKIENYSLQHSSVIPGVEVKDYPKKEVQSNYPILDSMYNSDDKYERYWINQCEESLKEKGLDKDNRYWSRLEEEADIKRVVGEKLNTNMFSYPITLQHYVDLFWNCGSLVGAGRGSSCSGLNHYLLGITQLDPIQWNLPFWRYLNKERIELGDIDIDICPSKKGKILNEIKKERGQHFNPDVDELSRKNLGCVLVATFGTEGTRSTILTACRGYRSEDYPDGIDVDTAQYLSSLVPQERGFLWPLHDVVYGNKDKGREASDLFVNEVKEFPGLLDIMFGIEGLVNKRSSHASGVIFMDEDPYKFGSFMRTPKGEIITAYDLHDCEYLGMVKYDFLVTEVQDKLAQTIKFLQEDGQIEKNLSLRQIYDKYFHPSVLPLKDKIIWKHIQDGDILNIFQFDSDVGSQAAKKIKPQTILELADANGLMRLMASDGGEPPMNKYIRFKNNINLWYEEMKRYGLTDKEIKTLEPYFKSSYGVPPSQEQLMRMLMDKDICNFSLKDANAARKIVGKKQMAKIPALREQVLNTAKSPALGKYVWTCGIGPQMGYSFSIIHALAYSFIGFQTAYIATRWNPIYWDTACLVVNSGSLEEDENEYEEDEDGDIIGVKKKESSTDYAKLAKALGEIIGAGIKVSLVDINKSNYGFEPDVKSNQILFGLKALSNVVAPIIEKIMENRPYHSLKEFMRKCPLNKTAMISLIKSGAFDNLESAWAKEFHVDPRIVAMTYYLSKACDPKSKLTLQNFNGLIEKEIVPDSLEQQKQAFIFNKYLKKHKKSLYYLMTNQDVSDVVTRKLIDTDDLEIIQGIPCIKQKTWDKNYQVIMDLARDWLKDNQAAALKEYNTILFKEAWDKYASGNISSWEMEALCFYYHDHELKTIDNNRYGIVDFNELSTEPIVDRTFKRNGKQIPLYKLYKIAGTVISKNDSRHSISLLTTTGVVNVKFTKEYYALYGRQLSEIQPDGTKKVREKGWFVRGTKLLITGFRRDDTFVSKNYKSNGGHQLYKINAVNGSRMEITHTRYGQSEEN